MTSLKDQNKLLKDAGKGVEAELKSMVDGVKNIDSKFQEKLTKKKYTPEFKKNAILIPTKGDKK